MITDYCRGVLLFDDIEKIRSCREFLDDLTVENGQKGMPWEIKRVWDRYAFPTENSFGGIFITPQLKNVHMAEIQVHQKDYWYAIQNLHTLYKEMSSYLFRYGNKDNMPPEEREKYLDLKTHRKAELEKISYKTTNTTMLLAKWVGNKSCSWPYRNFYDNEKREFVQHVAAIEYE